MKKAHAKELAAHVQEHHRKYNDLLQAKIESRAIKDKKAINERNERKAAEIYSQYNFEPSINNVSRALATRGSSTQELIDNRRGQAARRWL